MTIVSPLKNGTTYELDGERSRLYMKTVASLQELFNAEGQTVCKMAFVDALIEPFRFLSTMGDKTAISPSSPARRGPGRPAKNSQPIEAEQKPEVLAPEKTVIDVSEDQIMNVKQVAEYLAVGHSTIRSLIRKGELRSKKVGRVVRIRKSEVDSFFDGI